MQKAAREKAAFLFHNSFVGLILSFKLKAESFLRERNFSF